MGNTHYVFIYIEIDGKYQYQEHYRGESFFGALKAFISAKKLTKCRKWEWLG